MDNQQTPLFEAYTLPDDPFGLQYYNRNEVDFGLPTTAEVPGQDIVDGLLEPWQNFPWDTVYLIYIIIMGVIILLLLAALIYYLYRIGEVREQENKKLLSEIKANLAAKNTEPIHVNQRWQHVVRLTSSLSESDWRYAVIEADSMLDDMLMRLGYEGTSPGERLHLVQQRHFPMLQQARIAHRVRNRIAHDGSKYQLTQNDTVRVIKLYETVFRSMGYI